MEYFLMGLASPIRRLFVAVGYDQYGCVCWAGRGRLVLFGIGWASPTLRAKRILPLDNPFGASPATGLPVRTPLSRSPHTSIPRLKTQ